MERIKVLDFLVRDINEEDETSETITFACPGMYQKLLMLYTNPHEGPTRLFPNMSQRQRNGSGEKNKLYGKENLNYYLF